LESNLPVLVIVVPLLTALLVAILDRRGGKLAASLATAALLFSVGGAAILLQRVHESGPLHYNLGRWPIPMGIEYALDGLNAMVLLMVASVGLLSVFWMRRTVLVEIPERVRGAYYAVFLLCITGYMGITITGDVFNLYVFLEIASITTYVLIAMGRKREALYAGFSYLIVGSLGATFILLGIGHLYMATGSLAMSDIAATFAGDPSLYESSVVRTSFAFFAVGLAMKMALFPLHGWQPNAYTQAPSGASLFIAGTATKVSAYATYRITITVFGLAFLKVAPLPHREGLMIMAASAIVVGPLLAIRQTNLKRLLAYSSVGQIGYIMLGLVMLNESGLTGGIMHFWNHAAAKGALFLVAGALAYRTVGAKISDLAGMGRRAPWTASILTVAGLSMVGVPLTAGFLSKWYLGAGAIESGRWVIVPVLMISSLFTAVYVWRLLQLTWFAPADVEPAVGEEVPWSMRIPGLLLAAACLVLGMTPIAVDLAAEAARALLS